jgi:kynurenine formamidase/ketosteroid isomerase-like protein
MKAAVPLLSLCLLFSPPGAADDRAALEDLLNAFLAGASANDPAAHERFWADDLVYTSSNGTRRGKPEILTALREVATAAAREPALIYSAADVDIRIYGDTAVVAFRLLGQTQDRAQPAEFFNTGTFLKRDGEWRAAAWQATRIPRPDADDEWIDLSHELSPDAVFWPTAAPFAMTTDFEGMTDKGYYYSAYSFCTAEHGGTHIDAPVHFAEGAHHVNEIPVERLVGPAVVVDVSAAVQQDRDHRIAVADLEAWEAQHGAIPAGSIVLFRTGFGQYWPDAAQYLGTARRGAEAVAELSFPGLHPEAAGWLIEHRGVKAAGIDTASIDYGKSTHFETHVALMTHNVPAFENVANLDRLPPTGAFVVALPAKIRGGSGGPLRIVARLGGNP